MTPSDGNRLSHARSGSLGEEIANVVTHGIGVALSGAAIALLLVFASRHGTAMHVVASAIYGATLLTLYTASTVYHSVSIGSARAKHVAKIVDHSSIYLLIAGTYTPFTLVTLRGPWGWSLFGVVWGLAVVGGALEAFWVYRPRYVSTLVYLAMGWLVVVAVRPLLRTLPAGGLWLLLSGGLAYSLGTIFYLTKRIRYMHAVWHGFVLAGSVLHFLSVLWYVLPSAPSPR
jgi:hemolysin III